MVMQLWLQLQCKASSVLLFTDGYETLPSPPQEGQPVSESLVFKAAQYEAGESTQGVKHKTALSTAFFSAEEHFAALRSGTLPA
jgi:hypothetical protein